MKTIILTLISAISFGAIAAGSPKLLKKDPVTGLKRGFDATYNDRPEMCNYKKFPRHFVKMKGVNWDVYIDTEYEEWTILRELVVKKITESLNQVDKILPEPALNFGKQKTKEIVPLKLRSMSESYNEKPQRASLFKIYVMLGKRSKMGGKRPNGYEYVKYAQAGFDPRYPKIMERSLVMHCGEQILRDAYGANLTQIIVHEYAHFYHYNVFGGSNKTIWNAWFAQHHLYKKSSGAWYNQLEYFAELSNKYWYQRSTYYPFTRKQLEKHDKIGFELIKSAWSVNLKGVKAKTNNSDNTFVRIMLGRKGLIAPIDAPPGIYWPVNRQNAFSGSLPLRSLPLGPNVGR